MSRTAQQIEVFDTERLRDHGQEVAVQQLIATELPEKAEIPVADASARCALRTGVFIVLKIAQA